MEPSVYGPFPYVPIARRPKITWPGGARLAVWVLPNIEFFSLKEPLAGFTQGKKGPAPSVRAWAQRDYGNRVGIWRIMDVLKRYGIRASATVNSDICDYHPEIIEEAVKLGWELLGHDKTNTEYITDVPPERERQHIHDVLARIERASGRRPRGWLGAGLAESWNTLDHLIAEECLYVADWVNDDQPYLMNVGGKQLVSIPYSFEINDSPQLYHRDRSAEEFETMIVRQFEVLYREGEQSGRVMAICLHPYLIGVPHRIGYLDSALEKIASHAGVWFATGEEIVRHYLASGATF